ncbi:MAG: TrkA family potassium uptake protein [Syntrophaceae bacterium]|nr:TrkA family potassium uptake protein [Syntrophaceae bacterium]
MVRRNKSLYHIVIIGCGRLGSHLANRLSAKGHSLIVIDNNPHAFDNLSAEFSGFRIEGDAAEFGIINKAKTSQADIFIASTSDDNINLMVAQVARKIFNVPHVIARVVDPKKQTTFQEMGVETICPTFIAVEVLLDTIAESLTKHSGKIK